MKHRQVRPGVLWNKATLSTCALILCACTAQAQSKISSDLPTQSSGQVDVIVQFAHDPTAELHQHVLRHGGTLRHALHSVNGAAYSVPASALNELANDPNVTFISPDRPIRMTSVITGPQTPVLDYHHAAIQFPSSLALDGRGVGVAIIDSGIASVADLPSSSIVYSQDFTSAPSSNATDLFGHGTHVAGLIAGNGQSSTGYGYTRRFIGLAPKVQIVNLRVLDQNGASSDSYVIAAIERAIQLKSTYNIRVINLSLGRGVFESFTKDPLCQAVERAWKAGIVVVVAAGNDGRSNAAGTNGYGTISAPGNDPYVITVGAMNTLGTSDLTDDVPATYSSKGPSIGDNVVKPDLVAPGNLIASLYGPGVTLSQQLATNIVPNALYKTNGTGNSGSYLFLSGTSMATPLVTGTVSLMLQQNSNLTPDQVKLRLMASATKSLVANVTIIDPKVNQSFDESADIFTVGAGYLNVGAVLSSTVMAPASAGSAMSPIALPDAHGNLVAIGTNPGVYNSAFYSGASSSGFPVLVDANSLVNNHVLWGTNKMNANNMVWDSNVIPGTGTITNDNVIWGNNVIWGTDVVWGTNAVWGTSVVWGTNVIWSSNVLWGSSLANYE